MANNNDSLARDYSHVYSTETGKQYFDPVDRNLRNARYSYTVDNGKFHEVFFHHTEKSISNLMLIPSLIDAFSNNWVETIRKTCWFFMDTQKTAIIQIEINRNWLEFVKFSVDRFFVPNDIPVRVNFFRDPLVAKSEKETSPEFNEKTDERSSELGNEQFRASDEVANFLRRGFLALEKADRDITRTFDLDFSSLISDQQSWSLDKCRQALTMRLGDLISVIGYIAREKDIHNWEIGEEDGFTLSFQHEIISRIYVRPDEASHFLKLLHSEIKEFVKKGGTFKGDWGALVIDNGILALKIADHQDDDSEYSNWELPSSIDHGI